MFACEKCSRDMLWRVNDKIFCPTCQRTDSSKWSCQECRQETGKKFFSEILDNGRLRCNQCGREVENPDFLQGPQRPQKSLRKIPKKILSQDFCGEVQEDLRLIIFNLPFEEGQVKWEIENNALKVKSLRLGFQYQEVIEIPKDWQAQEPQVKFKNGILGFSWEEN